MEEIGENSDISLDIDYIGEGSFRFPPGLDLGTSYGSYLVSRKSNRRRVKCISHGSKIPHLPPITSNTGEVEQVTFVSVYNSMCHLLESLNHLQLSLRTMGSDTTALRRVCITLSPAVSGIGEMIRIKPPMANDDRGLQTLQLMIEQLNAVIGGLQEVCLKLISVDSSEHRTLQKLYRATQGELKATLKSYKTMQDKLTLMEESANKKISELQAQLQTARELLLDSNQKLQSVQCKTRSRVRMRKGQTNSTAKESTIISDRQVATLHRQIDEKLKRERQLERELHEERLRVKRLQSRLSMPPPLTTNRHSSSKSMVHPILPTLGYSTEELLELADFKDKETASKTMAILKGQRIIQ